jgi:hypothetical protein
MRQRRAGRKRLRADARADSQAVAAPAAEEAAPASAKKKKKQRAAEAEAEGGAAGGEEEAGGASNGDAEKARFERSAALGIKRSRNTPRARAEEEEEEEARGGRGGGISAPAWLHATHTEQCTMRAHARFRPPPHDEPRLDAGL